MNPSEVPPAVVGRGDGSARSGTGTWISDLSVNEFACLRAAGFEPVGQVMGASVYPLARTSAKGYSGEAMMDWGQPTLISDPRYVYSPRAVFYAARHAAMREMTAECLALGGDGIIAGRVESGPFLGEKQTLAFRVYGTAVRAQGGVRPPKPFTSHLSAQEFTKLIAAGWIPVDLVQGVSVHRLLETDSVRWERRRRGPNQEVRQWNSKVEYARKQARTMLEDQAAGKGADGIVISEYGLKTYHVGVFRFVEAMFIGTAIAAFGSAIPRPRREWSLLERMLPALRIPDPEPERPPSVRPGPVIRLSVDDLGRP
jgi:uncharacterized protein YbjQ (UPF0145 family)